MNRDLYCLRTESSVFVKTLLISAITLFAGCGQGANSPLGEVSGTVTFQGKPVMEGEISFYSPAQGIGTKIPIDSSGHFKLPSPIEVGDYKVSIMPPPLPDPSIGSQLPPKRDSASIPSKYRSDSLSGLIASIKQGNNELSFDLKP